MADKIGDKKLGGVKPAGSAPGIDQTAEVHSTEAVGGVKAVAPTSSVGGIHATSAIGKRRPTRAMTLEEREALLKTIDEEAEKMFSSGVLPAGKKEVITRAVRMAVDAGLLSKDEEDDSQEPKK